ncbi:MAG TPA: tRNA (N(6)-L-threonylcarbamoyladenosine(37)-C(2))-methylthiotransferase MtaB [Alphaproteobacteria bacterium]|nr:tRNA (N(6)-L-threonylcarbamoyladenosine(37)-C(2))-methylthiotransferase MtaB [Alphaproteobacteria bacterium]
MTAPEIITFGCRLNIHESETMRRNALAAGLDGAVIVNTCAVTAEAERQARQAIRKARRERPLAKIIVTGCAAQIDPASFAAMPEVDHVIGNERKIEATSFLALRSGAPVAEKTSREREAVGPAHSTLQRAFVAVQNGCDHACTFCIIPKGRGTSRSVPMGAIAEETRALAAQGYREVVFTGVDIASYGGDLPGKPHLGQMVRRVLAQVPELPRLRLSSLDPAAIDEDLWRALAEEPRLMPHWHLSLQAGDDMILKRMKRRHARADVVALCDRARRLRPGIAFGADLIAGFPTESDAMFRNTEDLVEECGLTWLHVFPYSARKGTPAARMPQVHGALRKERAERLRALGEKAATRHVQSLIGKSFDVLVEKNGFGRTRQFAKVKLAGHAPVGEIVTVKARADAGRNITARWMT